MDVKIRRAENKDIENVMKILGEVLEIHAALRPDIFISGTTKYTKCELEKIFADDNTPVFVAVDDADNAVGYVFAVMEHHPATTNTVELNTLYIDDICIDSRMRGSGIGEKLYNRAIEYAKSKGCTNVTLNVWEGNTSARRFYEKMGMKVKKTMMEVML